MSSRLLLDPWVGVHLTDTVIWVSLATVTFTLVTSYRYFSRARVLTCFSAHVPVGFL